MKILFVAEFFAPDSAIGALRITKLAKYMSKFGHEVSVLCSAGTKRKKDMASLDGLEGIRIGRFDQKDENSTDSNKKSHLIDILPYSFYRVLRKVYRKTIFPIQYYRDAIKKYNYILRYYQEDWKADKFDVIFATYSTIASVCAGSKISELSQARLVVDLRDPMDSVSLPWIIRMINRNIEKKLVYKADAVLYPSRAGSERLKRKYPEAKDKIYTLYNGYDNRISELERKNNKDEIVFVYTGDLYLGRGNLAVFFSVIQQLESKHKFKIKLLYAGQESKELYKQAAKYNLEKIIVNYGEVSRSEAEAIQNQADIFLVVTLNTKKEQGVMTGKFYEGIRGRKPILVLVNGEVPDSELYKINEEFHYGFCYEESRNGSFHKLYDYLVNICEEKTQKGFIEYNQSKELEKRFHYKNLAKNLEYILTTVCEKNEYGSEKDFYK